MALSRGVSTQLVRRLSQLVITGPASRQSIGRVRSTLLRRHDGPRVTAAMVAGHRTLATQAAAAPTQPDMFCFQCEQAKQQKGCTEIGVCGKTPQVAALQDLLLYVMKGAAVYGYRAEEKGATIDTSVYSFTMSVLFSTLTNVNFDPTRFQEYISEAVQCRDALKAQYEAACADKGEVALTFDYPMTSWTPSAEVLADVDALYEEGRKVSVRNDRDEYSEDVHGVRQMIIYGLKGMASYARHAELVGKADSVLGKFVHEALWFLIDADSEQRHDINANLGLALRVGEMNLLGMKILNEGHIERFGIPTPTGVKLHPTAGKALLVSGHDMNDMEKILQATEGTGVNVYTHGEMLPAHGYPGLNKYKHLVGHWGGAWHLQKYEWADFPGPVLVTTNCIIEPLKSYRDRLFTLNEVGWPGVRHLSEDDMQPAVEEAQRGVGFTDDDVDKAKKQTITVGFGHDAIIANAGTVLKAIEEGELRRIFLIGGCDGRENRRSYFTKLAVGLPADTLVLTLGCGKYRFHRHEFGTLGTTGLPRLLDLGQCNDAYSAVLVAQALADALGTDVNSLPLSIVLSWLEQKAVAVLLSLLSLGLQNIRIGPVLPAFITPNVLQVLVDKFNVAPCNIKDPAADAAKMMTE